MKLKRQDDDLSPREIIAEALAKHPPPPSHDFSTHKDSWGLWATCTCGWKADEPKASLKFRKKQWDAHKERIDHPRWIRCLVCTELYLAEPEGSGTGGHHVCF